MLWRRRVATMAVAVAVFASPAQAQYQFYGDYASWLAAVSNPGLDTFEDLTAGALPASLARSSGAYGYTASAADGLWSGNFPTLQGPDKWLTTYSALSLTLSNFTGGVRALGTDIFATDNFDNFVVRRIFFSWAAGDQSGQAEITASTASTFLGLVFDKNLTSLTFSTALNSLSVPTINNLRLAAAPSTTVPEPASVALVASGLVAIFAWRRRKRPGIDS